MIRKIMVILLPLCILYFLVGAILMWTNVIHKDFYFAGTGIVGALASVLGLLSFLRPAFSRSDIQNLETQSLQTLADVSAEMKRLETEHNAKASEISDLEKQKREMELLVRKASMALFLREQYDHFQRKILEHLNKNSDLSSSLSEIVRVKKKLDVLEEEIETDENVEILKSVVSSCKTTPSNIDILIESTSSPFLKYFFMIVRAYGVVLKRSLSVNPKR